MPFYAGIEAEAQQLVDLIYAPMYSKLCTTAIEMDLFSQLQQPTSGHALAEVRGWHRKNTCLLLDAVAGIGLLHKENGLYQNTKAAQKYLVPGSSWYIGDHMLFYGQSFGYDRVDIAELVRSGPLPIEAQAQDHLQFDRQAPMIRRMQSGGRAREMAAFMQGLPEYPAAKRFLDLGGGTGMLGLAIVKAHPSMQGVIFDLPAMGASIRESIRMSDMEGRVSVMSGNFLSDAIGSGYDLMLASATLNAGKDVIDDLMGKLYLALNPGGVLVCVGDGLYAEGTRPRDMVVGWLPYALQGIDLAMPRGVLSQAALKAGFRSVHTQTLPTFAGLSDFEVIRK